MYEFPSLFQMKYSANSRMSAGMSCATDMHSVYEISCPCVSIEHALFRWSFLPVHVLNPALVIHLTHAGKFVQSMPFPTPGYTLHYYRNVIIIIELRINTGGINKKSIMIDIGGQLVYNSINRVQLLKYIGEVLRSLQERDHEGSLHSHSFDPVFTCELCRRSIQVL